MSEDAFFLKDFQQVRDHIAALRRPRRAAVAGAADAHVIEAVLQARQLGIAQPLLIGNPKEIARQLEAQEANAQDFTILPAETPAACGEIAVEQVKSGAADFIMKGLVETRDVLKPLVQRQNGLNTGRTMSHVGFFEIPGAARLTIITDGGMIIAPTLDEKQDIIRNAVETLRGMGYACPTVAALCAVETQNPKMPETLDAAALAQMSQSGALPDCDVVGPISYDLAMDSESARIKRFECPHCGRFDILLAPTMTCGNILAKGLMCSAGAKMAGLIVGAKVPVVLTSRGSSSEEKLLSLAMAALAGGENRE